jgi:hypothetical protein
MENIKNWLIAEKENIIEFQKKSWEQGKTQLTENGETINQAVETVTTFIQSSLM